MPAGAPIPATLRWAIILLGAQAVGWVGLVALLIYADIRSTSTSTAGATGLTLFVVLVAALFGLFVWALSGRRAWARGPAIVLELLLLPAGYSLLVSGLAIIGIPVLLLAGATVALLLAPATRAALGAR
jgi:hypothetical protein